jgi:hypothetical protein
LTRVLATWTTRAHFVGFDGASANDSSELQTPGDSSAKSPGRSPRKETNPRKLGSVSAAQSVSLSHRT